MLKKLINYCKRHKNFSPAFLLFISVHEKLRKVTHQKKSTKTKGVKVKQQKKCYFLRSIKQKSTSKKKMKENMSKEIKKFPHRLLCS